MKDKPFLELVGPSEGEREHQEELFVHSVSQLCEASLL